MYAHCNLVWPYKRSMNCPHAFAMLWQIFQGQDISQRSQYEQYIDFLKSVSSTSTLDITKKFVRPFLFSISNVILYMLIVNLQYRSCAYSSLYHKIHYIKVCHVEVWVYLCWYLRLVSSILTYPHLYIYIQQHTSKCYVGFFGT